MAETKSILDEALIAKIKGIQIKAKHLANDVFSGEYESAFKGRGLEFEEVREYQAGDDVRSIDWNVTARYGRPFIKTFRDERELTVMFVVDVSASARFGTFKKLKSEVAAEITALLAYTAMKSNDKVGLIIFSDHIEHYLPPKKGKGPIWRVIREILDYKSTSIKTDLKSSLEFVNRCVKKRSIIFLISDFMDSGYEVPLETLSRRHDLIAISVNDQREISLPNIGYIELEDMETGESILVNSSDPDFIRDFSKKNAERLEDQQRFFRSASINYIPLTSDDNYLDPIIKFFRGRQTRK